MSSSPLTTSSRPLGWDMAKVTLEGGGKTVSNAFLFSGVVALVITGFLGFASSAPSAQLHSLLSYLIGFAVAVASASAHSRMS